MRRLQQRSNFQAGGFFFWNHSYQAFLSCVCFVPGRNPVGGNKHSFEIKNEYKTRVKGFHHTLLIQLTQHLNSISLLKKFFSALCQNSISIHITRPTSKSLYKLTYYSFLFPSPLPQEFPSPIPEIDPSIYISIIREPRFPLPSQGLLSTLQP